jgi:dihydrofolate reductase
MRKLIYGMNVTLDGYIAAPGDDIGWSGPPSDELFQWWLDQERASGLSLYGRKLWETMSSYWPTGDSSPTQPRQRSSLHATGGTRRRWRSPRRSTRSTGTPAWSPATRSPRSPGSRPRTAARWASAAQRSPVAAMRAGLIDEYALATYPVLVGGGTPFFTAMDSWVNLDLVETRTFPGGVMLTRYETRR